MLKGEARYAGHLDSIKVSQLDAPEVSYPRRVVVFLEDALTTK